MFKHNNINASANFTLLYHHGNGLWKVDKKVNRKETKEDIGITLDDVKELYSILIQDKIIRIFNISDREALILKMKWLEFKTFAEIGDHLCISRVKIRKEYDSAIEKFRYEIAQVAELYNKNMAVIAENLKLKEDVRLLLKEFEKINFKEKEDVGPLYFTEYIEPIYKKQVEQMDLSLRTINSLHKEGIATLGDIMDKPRNDFLRIRNFGKKSFAELEYYLKERFGLRLKR